MLIYFIHHVSVSLQADEIIARVGADLDDATDRLFPENSAADNRVTAVKANPAGVACGGAQDALPVFSVWRRLSADG